MSYNLAEGIGLAIRKKSWAKGIHIYTIDTLEKYYILFKIPIYENE